MYRENQAAARGARFALGLGISLSGKTFLDRTPGVGRKPPRLPGVLESPRLLLERIPGLRGAQLLLGRVGTRCLATAAAPPGPEVPSELSLALRDTHVTQTHSQASVPPVQTAHPGCAPQDFEKG